MSKAVKSIKSDILATLCSDLENEVEGQMSRSQKIELELIYNMNLV